MQFRLLFFSFSFLFVLTGTVFAQAISVNTWHGGSGSSVVVPTIVDVTPAPPIVSDPRLVSTPDDLASYVQFIATSTKKIRNLKLEEKSLSLDVPSTVFFGRFFQRSYIIHITLNKSGLISVGRPWWIRAGKRETEAELLFLLDKRKPEELDNAAFLNTTEQELMRETPDPHAKTLALIVELVNKSFY